MPPLFQMCCLICTCFGKHASTVAFASLRLFGGWLLTMGAWDNIDEDLHVVRHLVVAAFGSYNICLQHISFVGFIAVTSFRAEWHAEVSKVMIPYPRLSFGRFGRM